MGKKEIKEFLLNNKGYLKWGKHKLANKFNVSSEKITEVVFEINHNPKNFKRLFFDIETTLLNGVKTTYLPGIVISQLNLGPLVEIGSFRTWTRT